MQSGVSFTDTFGPMIFGAVKNLQQNLEKASRKNAYYIQAMWTKGIRNQSLKSNPVKNWDELSEKYLNSKRKKSGSNLINVLKGDYSGSINVAKNNMGYYEVGTNANHEGFYYPLYFENKTGKAYRPSLAPVLILSKDTVLENFKDALKETFKK